MASDLIASSPPIPQHELHFQNHSSIAVAATPDMSRRGPPSVVSDSPSYASLSATWPPYLNSVNPKPAYVSQDSASRVTTELYRVQRDIDSEDEDGSGKELGGAEVTDSATQHVNSFLDKVLHDILSAAASTSLPQLRIATGKTLRKNMGAEAIQFADANLEDLLATEVDEEEQRPETRGSNAKWNLEYVWKRSRLRVMMRSENSDFDIDDDDQWAQQEALLPPGRRSSDAVAVMSLQSEIFLAGVLDYVADSLFHLSIIPASVRIRRGDRKSPTQLQNPNLLIVEEVDLERGVLNSPLDKIWRVWRKSQRPSASPRHGRTGSNLSSPVAARRPSNAWADGPYHITSQDVHTPRGIPGEYIEEPTVENGQRDLIPDADEHPEHIIASNIPLPLNHRDVDEIEVPGLAQDPDEYEEELVEPPRRQSLNPLIWKTTKVEQEVEHIGRRPGMSRRRSSSAPPPFARNRKSNRKAYVYEPDVEDPALKEDKSVERVKVNSTDKIALDPEVPGGVGRAAVVLGAAGAGAAVAAATASRIADFTSEEPEEQTEDGDTPKTTRRNREAAVGFGHPNGISLPGRTSPTDAHKHEHISVASSAAAEPEVASRDEQSAPNDRTPSENSKLRAGTPNSESETSEIVSPRDFMAARNLQYTRSQRSDSLPGHPMNPLGSNRPPPVARSRLQTSGLDARKGDSSPVTPITPDNGLGSIDESSHLASVDTEQKPTHRRATNPRLPDDLARVRGSPKSRQASVQSEHSQNDTSPVHRKESLRRIAVERNGSLVSLVDESTHRIRQKAPLTSSSITSAEDFDSLLNGGETIKMTLSPSTVREAPSAPTSRSGSIDHSALAKLAGGGSPRMGNLLQKKQGDEGSMKSPSIGSSDKDNRGRTGSTATLEKRHSSSRPTTRNKSTTRAGLMAREATIQTDSTRDFADFIRSTGPGREPQTLVPALTTRTPEVADAQRQSSIGGRSIGARSISAFSIGARSIGARSTGGSNDAHNSPRVSETAGVTYKQSVAPREARGSVVNNDGLIDAIRTGPESGKGDSRPAKNIAPFRYSGDFEGSGEAPEIINMDHSSSGRNASLTPSMANGSYGDNRGSVSTMGTAQTMTTYNSMAPLVSDRGPAISTTTTSSRVLNMPITPKIGSAARGGPKKTTSTTKSSDGITRYRNKDPYAISDDDSDYDDVEEEPVRPRIPQLPRKPLSPQQSPATKASPSRSPNVPSGNASPPAASPRPGASGLALNGVSYQPLAATSPPPPPAKSPSMVPPPQTTTGVPSATAGPDRSVVTRTAAGGVIPRNPNRGQPSAGAGMARRKETSTRELADFFRDSGPPGEPTGKAAAMMSGGGARAGAGVASGPPGGRYVAGKDQLFGGSAPSPNIGGSSTAGGKEGKDAGEKKGKFWSRKRYLDLP